MNVNFAAFRILSAVTLGMLIFLTACASQAVLPYVGKSYTDLQNRIVPNTETLRIAARESGLLPSEGLQGYVDKLEWLPDGSLKLGGWAVDRQGDGSPLSILVFANGKSVQIVLTTGERPDVKMAFGLSDQMSANLAFSVESPGPISCGPVDSFVVVAISKNNEYAARPFWKKVRPSCR